MTAPATPVETIGNLKQQWKLVLVANRDRSLSRLDLGVLIEVIQKFYKAKGSGQAASRYLKDVLHAERRNIRKRSADTTAVTG